MRSLGLIIVISCSSQTLMANDEVVASASSDPSLNLVRLSHDEWQMDLNGNVAREKGYETLENFLKSLDQIPSTANLTLNLNSGGGYMNWYSKMSHALRNRCAYPLSCMNKTHLRSGAKCASACVQLFMAGDIRTAEPDTKFGFHARSYVKKGEKQLVDGMQGSLISWGIRSDWVKALEERGVFKTFESTDLSPDQLEGAGILTSARDFPKTHPSYPPFDDIENDFLNVSVPAKALRVQANIDFNEATIYVDIFTKKTLQSSGSDEIFDLRYRGVYTQKVSVNLTEVASLVDKLHEIINNARENQSNDIINLSFERLPMGERKLVDVSKK